MAAQQARAAAGPGADRSHRRRDASHSRRGGARMKSDPGALLVVQPGTADSYWQPVPANGYVEVHVAPSLVGMETPLGFGRQTVAPGCYVREHSHDRNEELIHCVAGHGHAVLDGETHP